MVQAHRTSSNLLEPHHRRDSKVGRVLPHEFVVVRLCRTLLFTGESRCAGCLCTSSGWFKYSKPPRTFSNHIIAEITRCVEFFHMSSEWFDSTEPFLTTSSQKTHGVQGARTLVRGGSSASNLLETSRTRACRVLADEFGVVRLYRTFSNYLFTEETRCAGCSCTSRGGSSASNLLEPSRTTASLR